MKCFIQSNNHYLWTQSRQQLHFPYKLFLFFFSVANQSYERHFWETGLIWSALLSFDSLNLSLLSHPFLHSRERQRESSRLLYSYIPSVEAGIQKYRNTICDTNNSPGVGKSLRFNCSFSFTTHNDTNLVHLSDVLSLIYCIHAFKTF